MYLKKKEQNEIQTHLRKKQYIIYYLSLYICIYIYYSRMYYVNVQYMYLLLPRKQL